MAQIHNTDLFKELKDASKLQQLRDKIPNELAEKVIPVIEVNPKLLRRCNIVRSGSTSTTSVTIYTTPSDRDFILSACSILMIKDAACDMATGVVNFNVVIDGATQQITRIPTITLTAQTTELSLPLPIPVKLDRNSTITITRGATTAGNILLAGSITGYINDVSSA